MHETANSYRQDAATLAGGRKDKGDALVRVTRTDMTDKSQEQQLKHLQTNAGNAAVTRMIMRERGRGITIQRKSPSPNAPDRHYTGEPTAHPEWPLFSSLLTEAGFSKNVVQNLWQLILGGLQEQEAINPASANPSLSLTERRRQRENNSWYRAAVEMLRENNGFTSPRMALWSGGLDVCRYTQSKGYTPMEFTRAGKAFNELEYHRNWQLQGPMWNILSKFYVEQADGPVHIFVRSYNTDSVLMGREVPHLRQLQRINPNVELLWHPVYTTESGDLKEISKDRRLVEDAAYASRDLCVAALYDYLIYHHEEANTQAAQSHKEMHEDLSRNVHRKSVPENEVPAGP